MSTLSQFHLKSLMRLFPNAFIPRLYIHPLVSGTERSISKEPIRGGNRQLQIVSDILVTRRVLNSRIRNNPKHNGIIRKNQGKVKNRKTNQNEIAY